MGSGIRIKGLESLTKDIKKLQQNIQQGVDAEMSASATTIALNAANAAPIDEGGLKGSIKENITRPFKKKVTVNKFYAPFVEFGTGKKVSVPSGLEAYAAGFKKKMSNGDFKKFVQSIYRWMKRHGIAAATLITQVKTGKRKGQFKKVGGSAQKMDDMALAYFIARHILRNGLKPRPFLFPAFFDEEPKLIARVQKLIEI